MKSIARWFIPVGLASLFVLTGTSQTGRHMAIARTRKSYPINRLYTGPDGLTHIEQIEAPAGSNGVVHLLPVTGAEIHRSAPNSLMSWHTEARRQYVITLRGHAEIEAAGGKKIAVGPGSIELVEDATGKGHVTKVVGDEERVALWLPLVDQAR